MAKISATGEITKPKYKVTNWKEYNAGLGKRGSLTLWFSDDVAREWYDTRPSQKGGQYEYSDSCIIMLSTLKSVFRLPFRQLSGFVASLFELMLVDLEVPSYTQICRRQKGLKVPPCISKRLSEGGAVHIVIDSSGLKIYGEGEWKVRKFGYSKRRTWRKIHLGVDENSGEILAQVLTDNKTDDASILPEIVDQVLDNGVDVDKVGADGAYDTYDNWDLLEELEIECIVPPRENAVYQMDEQGNPTDHPRNLALAMIDEGGVEASRKEWKLQSGYHRRSISETTFYRWKTIFGDKMYARKVDNQITETAIKSAILNRFIQVAKPISVRVA